MTFDAYFGPALPGIEYREHSARGVRLRSPDLRAEHVRGLSEQLRARAAGLRCMPVARISASIDQAAARIVDPAHELGATARQLLPIVTGYSPAMIEYVLPRMAADWTGSALSRLVHSEFGSAAPLDGQADRSLALGADLTVQIFSGNVPGVAVTALIRALLVKSPSFGKTARDEPVLPVLFARALQQVDPELAQCMALAYWPGGDAEVERALLEQAGLVVVYGGAEAVESVRTKSPARLVVHGPKLSFGLVHARGAADPAIARNAALAVATFDQQGCVSPHAIFVLGDEDSAREFALRLAEALSALEPALPRGRLTTEEAIALQRARSEAEFRGLAGQPVEIVSAADDPATVVLERAAGFRPSCLNRFVYVQPLDSVAQLLDTLRPHREVLQSAALAGFEPKEIAGLAPQLGDVGVSRVTTFELLPWPPVDWHHDGSVPLRELVRLVDIER